MPSDNPTTLLLPCRGDRRGDDTHWWKAYQVHSSVVVTPPQDEPPQSTTEENGKICNGAGPATLDP